MTKAPKPFTAALVQNLSSTHMKTLNELTRDYIGRVHNVLNSLVVEDLERVAQLILACHREERTVFVIGNGGSASTASHMACDLNKATAPHGRRLRHQPHRQFCVAVRARQ